MSQSLSYLLQRLKPFLLDWIVATAPAPTEGPGIDIVAPAQVGLGGDTILLFDSGGSPVAEYAATAAGLTAALAAATSGDTVEIPSVTITTAAQYVVPAGVTVRGMGRERTVIDAGYNAVTPDASDYFVTFDLGSGSVLEKLTVDVYAIRTVALDENVYLTGIELNNSIVRNVTLKIEAEYPYGYAWGIYGANLFGGAYEPTPTIENVSISAKLTKELDGTDQQVEIWAIYGEFDPAASDEQKTCIIRNVDIQANSTLDNTVDMFLRQYGIQVVSYHGRLILDGINVRIRADAPKAAMFEAYGIYVTRNGSSYLLVENSIIYEDITNSNGSNELYGIYGTNYTVRNCYINLLSNGDEAVIEGIVGNPATIQGCESIAHTTGTGVIVYGIEALSGSVLLGNRANGDTRDIETDTASINGNQYDSISGTLTYLPGDRGAYSVEDFHGSDIEAAALTRHLPLPGAAGNIPLSNGTNWIATPAGLTTRVTTTITAGSTTLDSTYDIVLCNATAGGITVNLPAAASNSGRSYTIKKIDASANTVTIDPNGGETLDDQGTQVIAYQYTSLQIVCDGSEWWIL